VPLRLAFMGTPDFAVPTLAGLLEYGHEIAAVYSQPPRPKGRGYASEPTPVAKLALARGIEVRTPLTLKKVEDQQAFAELRVDAAIVVAYGLLLPKPVLDAPVQGCFNLHASLLPRWRGAAPIQRAIMAGDRETGAMVMHMDEGLDTGPVLATAMTPVGRKTFGQLHDELAQSGASLMMQTLSALERGEAKEIAQPSEGATYAKKILKDEARIDWSAPASEIDCKVRGLSPFPGAWCAIRGERLKILFAEPVPGNGAPGQVLDDALTVACGEGALKLLRVQRAGRGPMNAADLLRGFPIPQGTMLA
jgi:methionyl-tRNA formyltransferase